MPVWEAGTKSLLLCRKCISVAELYHLVKELREEISRLHSFHEDEKEIDSIFSETLQTQEPQPFFTLEMWVGSAPSHRKSIGGEAG